MGEVSSPGAVYGSLIRERTAFTLSGAIEALVTLSKFEVADTMASEIQGNEAFIT
jgi:hypothetical protein